MSARSRGSASGRGYGSLRRVKVQIGREWSGRYPISGMSRRS